MAKKKKSKEVRKPVVKKELKEKRNTKRAGALKLTRLRFDGEETGKKKAQSPVIPPGTLGVRVSTRKKTVSSKIAAETPAQKKKSKKSSKSSKSSQVTTPVQEKKIQKIDLDEVLNREIEREIEDPTFNEAIGDENDPELNNLLLDQTGPSNEGSNFMGVEATIYPDMVDQEIEFGPEELVGDKEPSLLLVMERYIKIPRKHMESIYKHPLAVAVKSSIMMRQKAKLEADQLQQMNIEIIDQSHHLKGALDKAWNQINLLNVQLRNKTDENEALQQRLDRERARFVYDWTERDKKRIIEEAEGNARQQRLYHEQKFEEMVENEKARVDKRLKEIDRDRLNLSRENAKLFKQFELEKSKRETLQVELAEIKRQCKCKNKIRNNSNAISQMDLNISNKDASVDNIDEDFGGSNNQSELSVEQHMSIEFIDTDTTWPPVVSNADIACRDDQVALDKIEVEDLEGSDNQPETETKVIEVEYIPKECIRTSFTSNPEGNNAEISSENIQQEDFEGSGNQPTDSIDMIRPHEGSHADVTSPKLKFLAGETLRNDLEVSSDSDEESEAGNEVSGGEDESVESPRFSPIRNVHEAEKLLLIKEGPSTENVKSNQLNLRKQRTLSDDDDDNETSTADDTNDEDHFMQDDMDVKTRRSPLTMSDIEAMALKEGLIQKRGLTSPSNVGKEEETVLDGVLQNIDTITSFQNGNVISAENIALQPSSSDLNLLSDMKASEIILKQNANFRFSNATESSEKSVQEINNETNISQLPTTLNKQMFKSNTIVSTVLPSSDKGAARILPNNHSQSQNVPGRTISTVKSSVKKLLSANYTDILPVSLGKQCQKLQFEQQTLSRKAEKPNPKDCNTNKNTPSKVSGIIESGPNKRRNLSDSTDAEELQPNTSSQTKPELRHNNPKVPDPEAGTYRPPMKSRVSHVMTSRPLNKKTEVSLPSLSAAVPPRRCRPKTTVRNRILPTGVRNEQRARSPYNSDSDIPDEMRRKPLHEQIKDREISSEKDKLPTSLLQQQGQVYGSQYYPPYPQNPYFNPYVNPYNFHQYSMYGMPPPVPENHQTSPGPSSSNSVGSNANDIYPSQSHGMPIWPYGYGAAAFGPFPPYGSCPQQFGNQNQITQPYGGSQSPMSQNSEGSLSPHGFGPGHPVPPNFGNMVSGAVNMQYLQAPSGTFKFPTTPFVPISSSNGIEAGNTPSKKRTTQNAADLVQEVTKKRKTGVKYRKPSVLSKLRANVEKSMLRSSTLSVKRELGRDTKETEQLKKCKEDSPQRSTRDARTIQISDTSNCEQIEKEESDSSCSISNTPSRCDSENNKIDERISGVTKVEELMSTKKVGEIKNNVEEKTDLNEATVNSRDQLSPGTTEPETDEDPESSPISPSSPSPSTSINRTGGLVQRPKRVGGGRGVEQLLTTDWKDLSCTGYTDSKWMEAGAKKLLEQFLGYREMDIENNFEDLKKGINFEAVPDIWLAMQTYNIVLNDARNPKKTSGILSDVQQKLIVILHKLSSDLPNFYEDLPKLVLEYFLILIVPNRSHTFQKDQIELEVLGRFYGRLCGDIDKIDRSALTQRLIFDTMYWRSPHAFAMAHGIWRVNNAGYFYLSFEQMALKDQAIIFTLMRPPRFNDAICFQTLRELLKKSFQVEVPDITYDQFVTSVVTAIRGFETSVSLDEGSEILGMLFIFGGIDWTVNFLQTALSTLIEDWRIMAVTDGVFAAVLRAIGYFCKDSVESHDVTSLKKLLEIFLKLDNKSDVLVAAIKECVCNIDAKIQLNKRKIKKWNWVYAKRTVPSTVRNTNTFQHKKKKNSSGKGRSPRASGGVGKSPMAFKRDRGQRVFKKTP